MSAVNFTVIQDWGTGFEGEIILTNEGDSLLKNWTLEFTADFEITSIWNAEIVSRKGDRYRIRFADYNPDLSSGETISIGFNAVPSSNGISEPSGYLLNGSSLDPSGTPTISVADAAIAEGSDGVTYLTYTVTLSQAASETVTVDLATANDTAFAGEDYHPQSGTLIFAPGETSMTVHVPIVGDRQVEADERVLLNLSNPDGAAIADGQGVGKIVDDDATAPLPPTGIEDVLIGATSQPDTFRFDWKWGRHSVIRNFDVSEDVIDLTAFWFSSSAEFVVQDTGSGDVIISIPSNNQTIAIEGVTADQLTLGKTVLYRSSSGGSGVIPPTTNSFQLVGFDEGGEALQITLDPGESTLVLNFEGEASNLRVATNNPDLIQASIIPLSDGTSEIAIASQEGGRASLRIENIATGEQRFVGIRVRNPDGSLPDNPDDVTIGSVSEDSAADLGFWQEFGDGLANKRVDSRYIYLNGGPLNNPFKPDPAYPNNWRTWGDGDRLQSYLRESLKLGMTPTFVWYNIPDGGESYTTDLQHVQSQSYMQSYFEDLKYALDEISSIAGDEKVSMILEPDFLGYMAQNSGTRPQEISAQTSAIYDAGVLSRTEDPIFDDSVQGLVQAINYTISKYAPNVEFGWQFNLWASPAGGFTNVGIPGKGIVHLTETLGFEAGKQAIVEEATAIADYYKAAGVLSYGADFISIDKYGLDGAGVSASAAENPQDSSWFWNHDLWKNYLLFVETLHNSTDKPVTLWQIPVGHINGSQAENPYDPSNRFDDLDNTPTQYEDSAGTFFLGDTFIEADPERLAYFSQNQWQDPGVIVEGNRITWAPNMDDVQAAGVTNVLFGAGVGVSTDGVGDPPTDGYWWISQVQDYYQSLDEAPPAATLPAISVSDASSWEGDDGTGNLAFEVSLSAASDEMVQVNFSTSDGSAIAGEDFLGQVGTLTFAPGETRKTIDVSVIGDKEIEGEETLSLSLSGASGAAIADNLGLGTLLNDDAPDPVTPPVESPITNNGTVSISFQVDSQWQGGFGGSITITNQGDTAIKGWTLGFDSPFSITSMWNAEQVSVDGSRYVVSDLGWNEQIAPNTSVSFGFNGSWNGGSVPEPSNYRFNGELLGSLPSLSVNDVSLAEGDVGSSTVLFTVSLSAASEDTVTVEYDTQDSNAISGEDYSAASGSLTFAPGQTSQTVAVTIAGDTLYESSESFSFNLSNASQATLGDAGGMATILNDDANPSGGNSNYVVGAYYPEWAIYDRDFQVEDIPADNLTHIFYAFAKVDENGEVAQFDPWAATQTTFGGKYSWDQSQAGEAGNFAELRVLKAENPHLTNMLSIGGWALSGAFSDIALTDVSREKFAISAVDFMVEHGFDGLDIDWEYPVSGGLASNVYRPADKQNYTLLLAELREQLDRQESLDGNDYQLTIASPAGVDKIVNYDLAGMSQYLDFFNVMAYDYHGAWEDTTNHQAALYASSDDPSEYADSYNVAATVQQYLDAGVEAEDIVLGAPLYGRSWTGVDDVNDGLFQAATGAGPGTYENGIFDYDDLYTKLNDPNSGYVRYWDDEAQVPYVYNKSLGVFSTYEDVQSLGAKLDYVQDRGLGGMFFWEASADLPGTHAESLIGLTASELLMG
ncbi:MAG: glycosyl hydrolase family 18 protein [Synechococcus sp.]